MNGVMGVHRERTAVASAAPPPPPFLNRPRESSSGPSPTAALPPPPPSSSALPFWNQWWGEATAFGGRTPSVPPGDYKGSHNHHSQGKSHDIVEEEDVVTRVISSPYSLSSSSSLVIDSNAPETAPIPSSSSKSGAAPGAANNNKTNNNSSRVRSFVEGLIGPIKSCVQPNLPFCSDQYQPNTLGSSPSWDASYPPLPRTHYPPSSHPNRHPRQTDASPPFLACGGAQALHPMFACGRGTYGMTYNQTGPYSQSARMPGGPLQTPSSPHYFPQKQPRPQDILCGRGGSSNRHPGNLHFRELIAANKPSYSTLTKKQKMLVARHIVDLVHGSGGRFVARDPQTGLLVDIGLARSLEKTSQALREKTSNLSTSSADGRIVTSVPSTTTDGVEVEVTSMGHSADHDDDDEHDDQDTDVAVIGDTPPSRNPDLTETPQPGSNPLPTSTPKTSGKGKSSRLPAEIPPLVIPPHLHHIYHPHHLPHQQQNGTPSYPTPTLSPSSSYASPGDGMIMNSATTSTSRPVHTFVEYRDTFAPSPAHGPPRSQQIHRLPVPSSTPGTAFPPMTTPTPVAPQSYRGTASSLYPSHLVPPPLVSPPAPPTLPLLHSVASPAGSTSRRVSSHSAPQHPPTVSPWDHPLERGSAPEAAAVSSTADGADRTPAQAKTTPSTSLQPSPRLSPAATPFVREKANISPERQPEWKRQRRVLPQEGHKSKASPNDHLDHDGDAGVSSADQEVPCWTPFPQKKLESSSWQRSSPSVSKSLTTAIQSQLTLEDRVVGQRRQSRVKETPGSTLSTSPSRTIVPPSAILQSRSRRGLVQLQSDSSQVKPHTGDNKRQVCSAPLVEGDNARPLAGALPALGDQEMDGLAALSTAAFLRLDESY